MCGIFGMALKEGSKVTDGERIALNIALALENEKRGGHSWGAAVDVDAANNGLKSYSVGTEPKPWSMPWVKTWPKGLPQAWVEGFVSVGGIGWGGAWKGAIDPMHLEVYDPEG